MRLGMAPQKTLTSRAWADLIVLSCLWGGTFLAVRIALDEIGVFTIVAHRVFWGALVLWGVVFALRLPVPRDPRIWGAFAVMGILNNVIPFSMITWGQLRVETGLTAILNATTALFAILVATAFFADEKLTLRKAVGVLLGFAGVVTAVGVQTLFAFDLTSLAQWSIIGAGISYAFAGAWGRIGLGGLPPLVAAAGMVTASALVMIPIAHVIDGPISLDLTSRTWGAIAYVSVGATALAYLLYYRILAAAGSGNLLLVTLMIPPVAIVLGALVLGETLNPSAYLGFALLALGLAVVDGRILGGVTRTKTSQD